MKELISTGIMVSPAESKRNFDQVYSKFEVSVVRFKTSDFANDVKIADDEYRKGRRKRQGTAEERGKAQSAIRCPHLSEPEKKLTGKERVDALQKLSDKANDVVQALAEKGADFGAVASKFQVPVKATGEFTQAA